MYGIVNKAIEDLVKERFGEEKWTLIKERSQVEVDFFVSNEPYEDEITFRLATAVAEVMQLPLSAVLETFGEYWVLKTGKEKYGALLEAGGNNLKEFLLNLPAFHNRILLMYPQLRPPEFRISNLEDQSLHLHYYSQRSGLTDFVRGLIQGLGKMYQTEVTTELLEQKADGSDHDVFKVRWK